MLSLCAASGIGCTVHQETLKITILENKLEPCNMFPRAPRALKNMHCLLYFHVKPKNATTLLVLNWRRDSRQKTNNKCTFTAWAREQNGTEQSEMYITGDVASRKFYHVLYCIVLLLVAIYCA